VPVMSVRPIVAMIAANMCVAKPLHPIAQLTVPVRAIASLW
jgi:hypothetical protein